MEEDQISSSSDECDFPDSDDELISEGLSRETNESSGEDSDAGEGFRGRKIRIIENEVGSDVSEAVEGGRSSTWTLCENYYKLPSNVQFIPGENPRASRIVSAVKEPIDFFKLFFTDDLVKNIIRETNKNAKRKLEGKTLSKNSTWRNWRDVTEEEFWAFLAVVINMGTMPLGNLQEYWARNVASYIPFYSDTFVRERFSKIFYTLHLETVSALNPNPQTRLQRVNSFLDHVNSKFLDYFIPGEHICVNESTIKFNERISFITHPSKKSRKSDITVHTLADSKTGYICSILPYYGALTAELLARPDLPLSSRIPLHLYQMLLEKIPGAQGHHMYTDRHYTSYILAQELAKLKCHLTGTILRSDKELPTGIKKANFLTNSTVAYRQDNTLVLGWKDKRVVTCLTTRGDTGMTTVKKNTRDGVDIMVKKPNIVLDYLKHRGGVDRANQYASTYCFLRKSFKWWRKLFFWGMKISLINSYILYKLEKTKKGEKPLSHLRYLKTLVEQLRGSYRQQREHANTSDSDEIRLNGKLHIILKGRKKDCRVCSDRKKAGGRRETSNFCDTCPDKPRLHLGPCFTKYHTKTNYKV